MSRTSEKLAVRPAGPYVHLGDRLLAVARLKPGELTTAQAARTLGVTLAEIRQWQKNHAGERNFSLNEFRVHGSGEQWRLRLRAKRLAHLVARADRILGELHKELIGSVGLASLPARGRRASSK